MLVKISDIKIGNRFRQDLGEIGPLVDSIKRHGLLHPIVITDKNELICGRRRIEAFAKLGRKEIEANNVSLHDSNLSECEADENIVRKNFTVYEIAQIDQFYREKEEAAALMRQKNGKASENFAKGRSSAKIAARVGVSDRTLEKIRTIQDVCTKVEDPQLAEIWKKVGECKLKVNKGYNQVKRFQRIKGAERLHVTTTSNLIEGSNSKFQLELGRMQELGKKISANSIDMIFTDPPYKEASLFLYGELAKLAQKVLKPGGSLITFAGHYAIFKINDLVRSNSDLRYHWQIIVKHNGSKSRMHSHKVWPYYKPLLWYYKLGDGNGNGPRMYYDIADLIESKAVSKDSHEWEQSIVEAKRMIEPLTVKGDMILDPFMGSATTGEAALDLERKFIGIEIDKVHYSNAAQRLVKFASLSNIASLDMV